MSRRGAALRLASLASLASLPAFGVAAPQVASRPVASPPVASPQVASPQVASPQVASRPVASPQVASPPVASPQVASPQVASPPVASPQVALPQVASPQVASPQVAEPRVASPRVAEPHVAASRVAAPRQEGAAIAAPVAAASELMSAPRPDPTRLAPSAGAAQQAATARFRNGANTFQLDLPDGWRQLAPNEARAIAENLRAPRELCFAQPHLDYAVGPVDRWLAGDFDGPFLYVVESRQEFHVADDFATALADGWARRGVATGIRYELRDVARTKVGSQQVDAIVARRRSTPADGRPAVESLDVHCPDGGNQVTLSFCAPPEQFAAREPAFRQWLSTLTFARTPRAPATLGDRLWPPAIVSVVVCVLLWLAWRHTRARR